MLKGVAGVLPLQRVLVVLLQWQRKGMHESPLNVRLSFLCRLLHCLLHVLLVMDVGVGGNVMQGVVGVGVVVVDVRVGVEVRYGLGESILVGWRSVEGVGELLLDLFYFGEEHVYGG